MFVTSISKSWSDDTVFVLLPDTPFVIISPPKADHSVVAASLYFQLHPVLFTGASDPFPVPVVHEEEIGYASIV